MRRALVHILLAEDDEDDYLIVRDLLSEIEGTTFQIDWVSEYHEAKQRIQPHRFDVFLFDYRLGSNTGLDLIKYVRTMQCATPCILLTSQDDRHVDVDAGENGAVDYLLKKELTTTGLERSIRYALERQKSESERAKLTGQLLETSRQLGMAEVAASVLHNVGNVLNSINVSVTQLTTLLQESYIEDIGRIANMVQAHHQDLATFLTQDAKGKHVPTYLAKLGEHVTSQHQSMFNEIQALIKNLDHVKNIIRAQQVMSKATHQLEPIVASELMEQALIVNFSALPEHHVTIIRDYADIAPMRSEKHQILQILVNLIRNAKQAMIEKPGDSHVLRLTINQDGEDGPIQFSVQDTGVGIHPDHLTRIFSQGFTTKQDGHGLGLHSCALAAKALQGDLQVFSEGEGHGARFTLELPFTSIEVHAA